MSTTMSSSSQQTASEPHVPCHHNEREVRLSVPPADWVNQTSFSTANNKGGFESHFDFFYHVIFTFVHSALTLLLAPVLKTTSRPNKRRQPPRSSSSRTQRAAVATQSLREVDPELAMMAPENRAAASSNNSSSILKSQRRRSSGDQPQYQAATTANAAATAAAKSVRFPEPKRSRPPLGRISSSIGSTSVGSSSTSVVSESSSSSSSSSNGRVRIASRYTLSPRPRTHHSTYFLSD